MSDPQLLSGKIPFAVGHSQCLRLSLPFTADLCLELRPHSPVPARGSASSLCLHHAAAQLRLRLDFAYNKRCACVDFRWSQDGPDRERGARFMPWLAPRGGARCFKQGLRVWLVRGVLVEEVALVQSSQPLQAAEQDVAREASAWLGARSPGLRAPACVIADASGSAEPAVYSWPAAATFVPLPEALPHCAPRSLNAQPELESRRRSEYTMGS